ncbi:MAG: cardiolipin synthase B [Holophagales bacterium]|nr:cardiolipin synthase B [Holophagales bacterium]
MRRRSFLPVLLVAGLLVALSGCATALRLRYRPALTSPTADPLAAFTLASGNEPVGGNAVQVLENGDGAFPAMLDEISSAQTSIHLEAYIFRDGVIARRFATALAERARAGVAVRLLVDAIGSAGFGEANEQLLRDAGATVVFFRPIGAATLLKVHLRTHRKVLIVDGRVGFVGGICFEDEWLGNADLPTRWRDTVVRVQGPVTRQLQAAFGRAWLEATGELLAGRALYPSNGKSGEAVCQVMDSTPGFDSNPARLSFLVAVGSAASRLDITSAYFVPDGPAKKVLAEAVKRGVCVRILLPGPLTDLPYVRYAGRNDYHDLLEAGVEIWEYQRARLHAKTLVVDGSWASVGSSNLTNRSFSWNYESNVHVFDSGFAREMELMFERDLADSRQITLAEWKQRSFGEKFLEWMHGLLRSQY